VWRKSLLRYGLTLKTSVIYKQNCERVCGRNKLFKVLGKKLKGWVFDGVEINYMRN
jgi:hypothetical protein